MTNTIELLETIGRDASLRHASGEDLASALTRLFASERLKQAAISGDSNCLIQELGRGMPITSHAVNQMVPDHDDGGDEGDADPGQPNESDQTAPAKPAR